MPTATSRIYAQAVTTYQAGQIERAGDLCKDVLNQVPDHAGCLHLAGLIEFRLDHPDIAETLMRKSLALKSDFPEIHYNFALVLTALEKDADAIKTFQSAIALRPHYAEAHFALGNILKKAGQPDSAADAYRQAIASRPDYPAALVSLGAVLCMQKKLPEAVVCFERALELNPALPEALNNLGAVYYDMGKFSEAARCCERALALQPDYIAALNNLGNALKAQGKLMEAWAAYKRALKINPDIPETLNNLGLITLHSGSDVDAAEQCFRQVLNKHPDNVQALNNLGVVLCRKGTYTDGINCYRQALALEPGYADVFNNLGNALRACGKISEAIAAHRKCVALQPGYAAAHNNLAMALLAGGDFIEGWREYEWRWKTEQFSPAHRNFTQPQWQGESAEGKTLFIHAEQGFGDTLQFCRYAALARAHGMRVVLEVPSPLVRLMTSLHGIDNIICHGQPLPEFDLHCPMLSLPAALGTQVETIPTTIPYLSADSAAVADWKKRFQNDADGRLKVGLVWEGNPRQHSPDFAAANRRRSIAPEFLAPLMDISGVQFYSLQKNGPPAPAALGLVDHMEDCKDFADTAALIMNLDLVISVDTSVVHLAGALGKPVWVLNRFDSCWRWLQNRDDSPWYPTLRLFRQLHPGDWPGVIARVQEALRTL